MSEHRATTPPKSLADLPTGDRGQRYEVSYFALDDQERIVFGWTDDLDEVAAFIEIITLCPIMTEPRVVDRRSEP
jgi:hypothetical protein